MFLLLAICLSVQDVKTNVCWALCRQDSYDTGSYDKKHDSCICGLRKNYKEYTDKQLKVFPKQKGKEQEDATVIW